MPKRPPAVRSHSLFGSSEPRAQLPPRYRANVDGGSRGNPGPAAYGVVIRDPRGEVIAKLKKYIGRGTNNVAEYYGLIAALDYAQDHGIRALRVESDSELLVKQVCGHYKVKSPELRPLFEQARKMAASLESFGIEHVYREQNAEADRLVNEALDETSGGRPAMAETRNEAGHVTPKVRARFRAGVLYPLEDLDLPDGAEVELSLKRILPS